MTARKITLKLKLRPKEPMFSMAGTEGTKEYVVLCATSRGRIGIRVLSQLSHEVTSLSDIVYARIRVEPIFGNPALNKLAANLRRENGWKQPDDDNQRRFSKMASGHHVEAVLREGLEALGVGTGLKYKLNPDAPKWVGDFLTAVATPAPPAPAMQELATQSAST